MQMAVLFAKVFGNQQMMALTHTYPPATSHMPPDIITIDKMAHTCYNCLTELLAFVLPSTTTSYVISFI